MGTSAWLTPLLPLLAAVPAGAPGAGDEAAILRRAVAAACAAVPLSPGQLADRIPGSTPVATEALAARDMEVGWKRRLRMPDGAEVTLERIAPGNRVQRLTAEYWAPAAGATRPLLALVAGPGCAIVTGRRMVFGDGSNQPVAIEHLDSSLATTGVYEPLDPPVPTGDDPGGVAVAIVDAGVNYLLPAIGRRLARDEEGGILGHDYWDLDPRPFDANPARSPFFPERHGTRTASLLLDEAPMARLVPYRYPRPDMGRMEALIRDAAAKGIVIVNLSMGSNARGDWQAFAAAAQAHPHMLFILSAGNDGRDIDAQPVYPAALRLGNTITVSSSESNGHLAPGSNWGQQAVDLLVPAERLTVTDFEGGHVLASGSSYAAVRISALAARLLATHPDWLAPELKDAILERSLPLPAGSRAVAGRGFIPHPDKAERYPPVSRSGELARLASQSVEVDELYSREGSASIRHYTFRPTFAYFEGGVWKSDDLKRHGQRIAEILRRCGIFIPKLDVHVLGGPDRHRYFDDPTATEIVERLALPKPTVYFVRDTLKADAYDAEAIGKGNSATRPALRYTVWVTDAIREPGIAVAHELAHILMDSGAHVETPGNLMRAETSPDNTALTREQCSVMVRTGVDNGLLSESTVQ